MQQNIFLWFFVGVIVTLLEANSSFVHAFEASADQDVAQQESMTPPQPSAALYKLSLETLSFSPGIKLTLSPTADAKRGTFPRVAVFLHRPYLWVVVTEPLTPDLSLKDFPPGYSPPEIIPHSEGFVMRFKIPSSEFPSIDFAPSGTWNLSIGEQKPKHPFGSMPFLTGKLFAFLKDPAYLAINMKDVVPVHLKDPEKETDLIVLPTADPGVGFPGVFRYANFRLLSTFQGLVFDPSSPGLTVTTGDFIKLSAEEGLLLSPLEDRRSAKKEKHTLGFLDFNTWQRHDLPYAEARQKLEDEIARLPEEEHVEGQFRFAQFLIAHGYGEEANAILRLMLERSPRLEEDGEFSALWGISYFLTQDPLKALSTLANPNLPPEIELWQGAAFLKLGFTQEGTALMLNQLGILINYPSSLKNELGLIAANGCMQNEDKVNAEKFLKMINASTLSSAQASSFASLKEDLIILGMDPALRESYVVQVMRKGRKENPRIIADKDFDSIQDRLQKKRLSPAEAIPLLEDLRTSWRGNDLEFNILEELGKLYTFQKEYFKAMESYGRAIRFFPHISQEKGIEDKAREVFQQALTSSLTPFRKIAFFNQYTGFLPKNDKKIDIVEKLTQELIHLDLPDQAIPILEKELDHKGDPRLLKHLAKACIQDRQPQKALRILNNPLLADDDQEQITYLRALAYEQLKNFDEALAKLEGNDTWEGQQLRARIFGEQKDWASSAVELEKMMTQTEGLDPELLLQLTMALYLEENQPALQDLRKKYQSLLPDTIEKKIFLLLTQQTYQGKINIQKIKMALDEISDFQELAQQLLQENGAQ